MEYYKVVINNQGQLKAALMELSTEKDYRILLDCQFSTEDAANLAIGAIHRWAIEHVLGGKPFGDR